MLRLITLSALFAAASSAKLSELSAEAREELVSELKTWKSSAAALSAEEMGVYFKTNLNSEDHELTRLLETKEAVAEAELAHPDATFSTNNPFALMSLKEFGEFVGNNGFEGNAPKVELQEDNSSTIELSEVELNASKDWRTKGCVGPIQQQGRCQSCWAFAGVYAVEGTVCAKTGKYTSLSVQQVTSCSKERGSRGCNKGMHNGAIEYIARNGVCTAQAYPWRNGQNSRTLACRNNCRKQKMNISGPQRVGGSAAALQRAINNGPVAIGVFSKNSMWKNYRGGVANNCPRGQGDHAITAIGYTDRYFLVKNQWGTQWGEQGYIKLGRRGCIKNDASFAVGGGRL